MGTFTNIGQATTISLTLNNLQASESGSYSVIVTNQFTTGPLTNSQAYNVALVEPFTQFTWSPPAPITTADATLGRIGSVLGAASFGGNGDRVVTLSNGTN